MTEKEISVEYSVVLDENGNPPKQPDTVSITSSSKPLGELTVGEVTPEKLEEIRKEWNKMKVDEAPTLIVNKEEEFTPKQQAEKDQADLEAWKANPENQEKVFNLATGLEFCLGTKWFTLERGCRKTGEKEIMLLQKINLCELFGWAEKSYSDGNDGKTKGTKIFKMTIGIDSKIEVLDYKIQWYESELEQIKLQRKILENQLKEKQQ